MQGNVVGQYKREDVLLLGFVAGKVTGRYTSALENLQGCYRKQFTSPWHYFVVPEHGHLRSNHISSVLFVCSDIAAYRFCLSSDICALAVLAFLSFASLPLVYWDVSDR